MCAREHKPVEIGEGVYWLSFGAVSGNVYFVQGESSRVLIDTSVAKAGPAIQKASEHLFGAATPAAIFLTHVHPDHAGSAPELMRAWDCPVYVPSSEMPLATARDLKTMEGFANPMDRWMILPIMRLLPSRKVDAILEKQSLEGAARALDPGGEVPGLVGWRAIATPGHTPGHLAFWRERDRVLISGDAVLAVDAGSVTGFLSALLRPDKAKINRPARYTNWDDKMVEESVAVLAALGPRVLATGHGPPITGDETERELRSYAERLG